MFAWYYQAVDTENPAQDPHKPLGELPANAELRVLVERIVEVADGREEAAGVLARKIFARLYEVSGSLCGPQACARRSIPLL